MAYLSVDNPVEVSVHRVHGGGWQALVRTVGSLRSRGFYCSDHSDSPNHDHKRIQAALRCAAKAYGKWSER